MGRMYNGTCAAPAVPVPFSSAICHPRKRERDDDGEVRARWWKGDHDDGLRVCGMRLSASVWRCISFPTGKSARTPQPCLFRTGLLVSGSLAAG